MFPTQNPGNRPGMPPVASSTTSGPPPRGLHPAVDPGNQIQAMLISRLKQLSPQDQMALATGLTPPFAAVLKKLLPEIGFIIDQVMNRSAGAPLQPQPAPAPAPGPALGPVGKSTTQLSKFSGV
jgi:hypothetical protein